MAPAKVTSDGQVTMPLDEHTRAIAEAAARAAVREHMDMCQIAREFSTMYTDMYGVPGDKETKPGLMGDMAEMRRSRKLILLALRGAWVLLTILLGAVATAALRAHL